MQIQSSNKICFNKETSNNNYIKPETLDYLKNPTKLEKDYEDYHKQFYSSYKINVLLSELNLISLSQNTNSNKTNDILDFKELPTISSISTIEYLIESSYSFNYDLEKLIQERNKLKELKLKYWRPINGDGNCFYRAVMFSIIEKAIIFKDIMLLKHFVVDICEMMEFFKVNDFRNKFADLFGEWFNEEDEVDFINSLFLLIELIENSFNHKYSKDNYDGNEEDILAYACCLKLYANKNESNNNDNLGNFRYFDIGLIIYLRFKIYIMILFNKDKRLSSDFDIKISTLLPDKFHYNNNDNQDLDEYFLNDLLKLDSYAEKIVMYLTPYVINTKIDIINYDYDDFCSQIDVNEFNYNNNSKEDSICLLYRKTHYDVGYLNNDISNVNNISNNLSSFSIIEKYLSIFSNVCNELTNTLNVLIGETINCNTEIKSLSINQNNNTNNDTKNKFFTDNCNIKEDYISNNNEKINKCAICSNNNTDIMLNSIFSCSCCLFCNNYNNTTSNSNCLFNLYDKLIQQNERSIGIQDIKKCDYENIGFRCLCNNTIINSINDIKLDTTSSLLTCKDISILKLLYNLKNKCMFCLDNRNDDFEDMDISTSLKYNNNYYFEIVLNHKDNDNIKEKIFISRLKHSLCFDCLNNHMLELNMKKCKVCDVVHS